MAVASRGTMTARQAARQAAQVRLMRRAVRAATVAARGEAQAQGRATVAAAGRSVQLAQVLAHAFEQGGIHWLDVRCEPSGTELTARWVSPLRSLSEAPRVGDEVVVLLPDGSLSAGAVVVGVVPNAAAGGAPSLSADRVHVETDARFDVDAAAGVRVGTGGEARVEAGGALNLRGAGAVQLASTGAAVSVQSAGGAVNVSGTSIALAAPSIALGSAGLAVARSGDAISVAVPAGVQTWIAAVSAALAISAPPFGPWVGTVTGGNPNVTA